MIIGGVVPVVNIKGIKPGSCTSTARRSRASTWATSPSGTIRDQEAQSQAESAEHGDRAGLRSDGSGTNFLFSDYLSKESPKFKDKIGANTSVQWPVGIGAKGNEGVANMTTQTDGAIGYVEYAYAKQNKMAYVLLTNKAGKAVAPNAESFQAAAANADWAKADSYYLILTDQAGAKSWPITGASFILVYKQPEDAARSASAEVLRMGLQGRRQMAADLDYVPLPAALIAQVKKTWATEHHVGRPSGGAKITRLGALGMFENRHGNRGRMARVPSGGFRERPTPWRSSIRGTPPSS
jgi:phosphate transport system substrate-binding protein